MGAVSNEIAMLRQKYLSNQYWTYVAGYIKLGETAEETAVREVREELGLAVDRLEYGGTCWFADREQLMHGFIGVTKKVDFKPSAEVDAAEWIPFTEAPDRMFPEKPGNSQHPLYRRYLHMTNDLTEQMVVCGAACRANLRPVILVGGHRSVENMETVLNKSKIEFVSLSGPLIRGPDLPNRWQSGDIAPAEGNRKSIVDLSIKKQLSNELKYYLILEENARSYKEKRPCHIYDSPADLLTLPLNRSSASRRSGNISPAKMPRFRSSPKVLDTIPTKVDPPEHPRSPANAISANMAVSPRGKPADALLNVPGHMIPTDRPHTAYPSNPTTGFEASAMQ